MKKAVLVTLADANYLSQAKQLFYGALAQGGWKEDMLLLSVNIPKTELQWFEDRGIYIYECPPLAQHVDILGKWPPVVMHKFLIMKTYFKQWDHVVFLDGDIIIRSNIQELLKVDMFSAVYIDDSRSREFLSYLSIWVRKLDWRLRRELAKSYDLTKPAFNSGVLTFPTSVIDEQSFDTLLSLQRRYGSISAMCDEGMFNLLIKDFKPLSIAYNLCPDLVMKITHLKPSEIQGAILHFLLDKPWEPGHPFQDEWSESCKQAEEAPIVVWSESISLPSPKTTDISALEAVLETAKAKAIIKRICYFLWWHFDQYIGLCGIIIKRMNPNLHAWVKKNMLRS